MLALSIRVLWGTNAIAMIVLKVSSMRSPSNMLDRKALPEPQAVLFLERPSSAITVADGAGDIRCMTWLLSTPNKFNSQWTPREGCNREYRRILCLYLEVPDESLVVEPQPLPFRDPSCA